MMFKTLFFILLTISTTKGAVTARWMTVASVVIDDGKTKLLFDPAWTRPGIGQWLNFKKLTSDQELVSDILKKNNLQKIDAVFASHSHFDHVMDAPMVSKLAGAVFYVDQSSERLAEAYNDKQIRTIRIRPDNPIRVGDFLITPILREHPKILHLFHFLPGEVPADTDLSFWDYHTGDTWFYLIEHPEGKIVLDQGCESHLDVVKRKFDKVDALIQGVANRKDDDMILNGYVKAFKPKVYIPLHFDNFFADFNDGVTSDLPGVKLEVILGKLKEAFPTMKVERPQYGKPVLLLEAKAQSH